MKFLLPFDWCNLETYQRMNKAVHVGSVPTAIINALRKLDDLGIGERSLILGAPAVYAYPN